jgi:hypothetical protein
MPVCRIKADIQAFRCICPLKKYGVVFAEIVEISILLFLLRA